MGEVDRITCRTAAALLATFAAVAALPAAAVAAPPTCSEPFELTVQGDAPGTYVPDCEDDLDETLTYAVASQPTTGTVGVTAGGLEYTARAGESGTDTFSFTATDTDEDVSETYPVTVTIQRAQPTVTLEASSPTATTGEAVTFTATAGDPDGGAIVAYAWTVNGRAVPGETSATLTRSFSSPGAHTVMVTVTDDETDTADSNPVTVEVSDPPNQPPVAAFHFAPSRPVVGQPVTFTSDSSDPELETLALEWDLDGDGGFNDGTGHSVTTAYATAGSRVVRLRATDPEGAATEAERTVSVVAPARLPATQPSQPPPAETPPPSEQPAPAIAADTTAPAFGVSRRPGQRLRRVRRRGLRFSVRCDEPCSVYLELLVSRKAARRLGINRRARLPVRIGRVTTTAGPERRPVTVKLTRRAARRLRRARRVTLTLQGSAFDAGGYTTLLKPRPLVIRR